MDDQERYESGMAKRRKVLGNDWVDKANKNKNPFNSEFQELITRFAWGEIWTRPHFDERTRRILVIGTLLALGHWDEFRMHVRLGLAVPSPAVCLMRQSRSPHPKRNQRRRRRGPDLCPHLQTLPWVVQVLHYPNWTAGRPPASRSPGHALPQPGLPGTGLFSAPGRINSYSGGVPNIITM